MSVRGHSRSLKMVSFESIVSYSPSTVTTGVSLAISEILNVKDWPDLEIWVWGRSRSLKWRRSIKHYDFLMVRHCNYSSISYHFQVIWCWNDIVTLKSGLEITQDHWNGAIRKLGCGILFTFYSIYGRIRRRLWDIQHRRKVRPWKQG